MKQLSFDDLETHSLKASTLSPLPLPRVHSIQEIVLLLDMAQGVVKNGVDRRVLLALHLLLDTGMKQQELMNLRVEDIQNGDPPYIEIRRQAPLQYTIRTLALSRETLVLVQGYAQRKNLQRSEKLFPCTAKTLHNDLQLLGELAGLTRVSCRSLRWSAALRFWQEKMEPDRLRRKLGVGRKWWRKMQTTLKQLG